MLVIIFLGKYTTSIRMFETIIKPNQNVASHLKYRTENIKFNSMYGVLTNFEMV